MVYDGYLSFGGNEVLNSERAKGIAESADCVLDWFRCKPCPGLPTALGSGAGYTYDDISNAPWYDPSLPNVSNNFYGVYGLSIENVADSTRQASVTEGISDGGVIGLPRRAVREIRVRALLVGKGREAVDYGMGYLDAVLDPDACGRISAECGTAEMQMYADCPPLPEDFTMPETQWGTPLTNLATNPSFETAGAPVALRTNLATNPSFEATTAATVEVRRNLFPNPGAEVNLTGISPTGGATTSTRVTSEFHRGTASVQVVTTGAASAEGVIQSIAVSGMTGKSYSTGAWVKAPVGTRLYIVTRTAGAAAEDTPQVFLDGNGAWQWFATPLKAAQADATTLALHIRTTSAIATTFYVDEMIASEGIVTEAFAGDSPAAGDFTYAWTGTANASASVQYGLQVPSMVAANASVAPIQSAEWALSGTKSMRLVPTYYPADPLNSFAYAGGSNLISSGVMQAGKTYTVMATLRLPVAQTGGLNGNARRMVTSSNGTGGAVTGPTQPPNVPGVYPQRWTFTVPADATSAHVRLYNGAGQGGGDVWWDDFLIVEGTYIGPYFDGSTPAKVRRNLATNPLNDGVVNSHVTAARGTLAAGDGFVRLTVTDASVAVVNQRMQSGAPARPLQAVSPGQVVTLSAKGRTPANFLLAFQVQFLNSTGGLVSLIDGVGTPVDSTVFTPLTPLTATVPAGASQVHWIVGISSGARAVNDVFDVTDLLIEVAPSALPFFDGTTPVAPYVAAWEGAANASPSYLYDPDFTYAWTGTANASTSTQRAVPVASVAAPNAGQALQYQTTDTPYLGTRALRSELLTTAVIGLPVANLTPTTGQTFTLLGRVRPRNRDQQMQVSVRNAYGPVFTAPKGVWTEFQATLVASSGTAAATGLVIPALSGHQPGDIIDIDAVALVQGEYGGAYFDGSFPDSPPSETIGDLVYDYAWTGAADASTSTVTIGEVVEVPDVVSYEQSVQNKLRFMRRAGVISGPFTIQEFARGDIFAREVEFTFAGGPAILGITRPIEFNPSIPGVVQDIPFNLAPYPSAELTSSSTDWVAAVAPDGGTLLHVPTHVSPQGGQTTHPSVLDFGATPFNGYRYWMAHTPYPGGNDAHEDPNIAASADGNTWVVPAGLVNPLDNQPGTPGAYNSDTELVVYPGGGLLMMWRTFDPAAVGGEEQYWTRFSTNGIVWSTKTLVHQDNMLARRLMSPTLIWENNGWTMWAVDILPSPNRLVRMRSEGPTMTPGGWTAPQPCTVTVPAGRDPWHVQIRRIGEGYVGLLNDCVLDTSGTGGDLYVITSTDGVTFTRGSTVAIPRAGGSGVGHQNLYRASLIQKSATQLDVWFAGWNTGPPPVWNIFRTTLTATLSGSVIIASNYAQNPSAELVEAGPTYTGWTSSVFIIPTGVVTLSRSTDIAAGGSPTSMRLRAAPVSGGNTGQMALQNNSHVFPVVTAGKRMSIGVWVNVARSGTATLGTLVVTANWKDAGGSLGVTTIPHALTIPGFQYISLAGIQPPVGADRVTVQIALNVASWSAGAIIDLYADTVLVSVP